MIDPKFWINIAACLIPYGAGVLGVLGIAAGLRTASRMDTGLKWAIVTSNAFYLILVLRQIGEPQYFLPPLAWLIIAASPGLETLFAKLRSGFGWRARLLAAIGMHLVVAAAFAGDLLASRVPDFADIGRAAQLLPPGARVVVAYRFYGAGPAIWLGRNVYAVADLATLMTMLPKLKEAGFTHICVLDIESRHNDKAAGVLGSFGNQLRRIFGRAPGLAIEAERNYASPSSVIRKYLDRQFPVIFEGPHVRLYSILSAPPTPVAGTSP
jgi:hypothetical protein